MRYVDEVIIGAPWVLTKEICASLNCSIVVENQHCIDAGFGGMGNPNQYAIDAGIYTILNTGGNFTSNTLIDRVIANNEMYTEIYSQKSKKLADYYEKKLDGKLEETSTPLGPRKLKIENSAGD